MKKGLFIVILVVLSGCNSTKGEEILLLKCQKLRSYEFYDGTNVIGVYGKDKKNLTKVEMVENYSPKWDDVDNQKLKDQLSVHKKSMSEKYKKISYTIEEYSKDIMSDITIPITNENIENMKSDDNYKDSISNHLFSIDLYKSILEENGYVCE